MMNILIVEDEQKTARLLVQLIQAVEPNSNVVAVCAGIEDTVSFIKNNTENIDLFFMDIHVSDGTSFEIFNQVSIEVPVIFCTAYDEFALKAFKVDAIDYILKPFQEEDIKKSFNKIKKIQLGSANSRQSEVEKTNMMLIKQTSYSNSFLVKYREKLYPVMIDQIALFCLEDGILFLYTQDEKKYSMSKNIDTLEPLLDPNQFYKINRGVLVNRNYIKSISTLLSRKVSVILSVNTKQDLTVSRLKVPAFIKWLQD
jgi:DNA-binding LytR/AlgR family response regulator